MPIGAGVKGIPGVICMNQINAAGDRLDSINETHQFLTAGMSMACVEAEADRVTTFGRPDCIPESSNALQAAGHRIVTASGVLDEQRHAHLKTVDALTPVVEADGGIVVLEDMAAVHNQRR